MGQMLVKFLFLLRGLVKADCDFEDVMGVGEVHRACTQQATPQPEITSMLQVDVIPDNENVALTNSKSLAPPGAEQRAEALKRVAWVHVAKAGSGFMNTLYHNPTLCPETPEDAWGGPKMFWGGLYQSTDKDCPGSWSLTYKFSPHSCGHYSIEPSYEDNAGHFVTMMRQPEQRVISMFNYWDERNNTLNQPWMMGYASVSHSLTLFAKATEGCVVKQFTSSEEFPCFYQMSPPPSQDDAALAVSRLQRGFAFVGLTDQWDLSICLFHAMFGGPCLSREFEDTRPGTNYSKEPYNISGLEGFVDVYDGMLYEEAMRIFELELEEYGTTWSKCEALCFP